MEVEPASGVFVVTLQAVERAGEPPLTVLAFAQGADADAAEAVAVRETARDGFTDIRALRAGEITDPNALPDDFREAMANARRYGCWLIIYEAP